MTLALAPLLLLMQVGPAPEIALEPLPMPRREQAAEQPVSHAPADDAQQAVMIAISGNQAIVSGDYDRAANLLGQARGMALAGGATAFAGEIGLDQARALILAGNLGDAAALLATLRSDMPGDADVWIASSVVARRSGDLAAAQGFVSEAAGFAPQDPAVGLEAGTIAYLAGNPEAARKSWMSVIELDEESDEATVAREYIEMLDTPEEDAEATPAP